MHLSQLDTLFHKFRKNKTFVLFLCVLLLIPFWGFLYFAFNTHLAEFGCFDDCNNFMGGYFLMQKKKIFTEFFFNHQMLMAYISYAVQTVLNPSSLYALVKYHLITVFAFSVVSGIFLIYRFGYPAVGFILLYELNKYYVFGSRFLAESFVIYVVVYLFGLFWQKMHQKQIYITDYIFSAIGVWFIIFIREPYLPLALFLYGAILFGSIQKKEKMISLSVFILFTAITLISISVPDMILNVFTLNKQLITAEVAEKHTVGIGVVKIIFYPFFIFFTGSWTLLREIQIVLSAVFITLSAYYLHSKKNILLITGVWIILILANLRYLDPGTMYYQSFRSMIWFGLLIFAIMLMVSSVASKKLQYACISILAVLWIYSFLSPHAFFFKHIDKEKAFTQGYGHYYITGKVIATLAPKDATLFVEGKDDMIYWQANIRSAYKYSWYTSLMPTYKPYTDARDEMFANYPPDFYVGDCDKDHPYAQSLPSQNKSQYVQIYGEKVPSCIYIKKSLLSVITPAKWQIVHGLGYHLPK